MSETTQATFRPLVPGPIPEIRQICDFCKKKGLVCTWPKPKNTAPAPGPSTSTSGWKDKKACTNCAAHKVRCSIEGVNIRPFRTLKRKRICLQERAHRAPDVASEDNDRDSEVEKLIAEVHQRIAEISVKHKAYEAETKDQKDRIERLEAELGQLMPNSRQH
ncbi:hypothetical protein BJ138DRAFT_1120312 [Hygrophoropsis aurantiaca]|uniref:Uncharacterized protein n=1 Tax=Hygrophoropsis aurantiaca TaxID=72124 RepID=A0ACB7ZT30_9AGAM|nr:hypothetical protein BJ138DRAFT_1120312 [Hygrophoropsis aurantiaca]